MQLWMFFYYHHFTDSQKSEWHNLSLYWGLSDSKAVLGYIMLTLKIAIIIHFSASIQYPLQKQLEFLKCKFLPFWGFKKYTHHNTNIWYILSLVSGKEKQCVLNLLYIYILYMLFSCHGKWKFNKWPWWWYSFYIYQNGGTPEKRSL